MITNVPTNDNNYATIQEEPLDEFLERSYRRYAVLTILDRALPDVRDGLKPVQRRILYAMHATGMDHNSPHKKSARVVGEVLGKYHPHSDVSVYDAMVRMAQDFSMRCPLIDGQGNFGSIDGDGAAAMRYTEARLSSIGEAMLADIEKDTVDWQLNFDDSLQEPTVLPSRFPNLLVNGSSGIAVGMSTSILPHNLGEVCEAVIYIAHNWTKREAITVDDLMKYIPGPDLPTGGLLYRYRVNGDESKVDVIRQAYETGTATLVCQAKADIQEIGGGKSEILITELPYQTQKATILERIASHKEKFTGITDVRDESDYNGMRIVFEVARGTDPQDVLDRLFTHTQMRASLSHNALALVQQQTNDSKKNAPCYLNLSQMLQEFIRYRLEVIVRRSQFELSKAEARLHIVLGLLKALSMIDEVINIIRRSQTTETAKTNLMKKLSLSEIQAQSILDMPLRRLAALERQKLDEEQKTLKARVKELKNILGSEKRQLEVVVEETNDIKDRFATKRRTVIIEAEEGHQAKVTVADMVIPEETQLILISQDKIQRVNAKGYRDNVTSGKPTNRAVEITLLKTIIEPTGSLIMVSNKGRLWLGNVGRIPLQASFSDIGLNRGEIIVYCGVTIPGDSLVLATTSGNIKRVSLADCINGKVDASWSPIIGLLGDQDNVLFAGVASSKAHVLICTGGSQDIAPRALRFEADVVNPQATPSARGVTAIKMFDDPLIGGAVIEPEFAKNGFTVFLTDKGYIKRVSLSEFPVQGRGGQGVLCWKPTASSGLIVGFSVVTMKNTIDIYSVKSKRLRLEVKNIPQTTRPAKGTNLAEDYGDGDTLFPDDNIKGLTVS